MSDWIRAANPLAKTESEADAAAAARMSAVALWLTAANGVVGVGWAWINRETIQTAMDAQLTANTAGQSAEATAMATSMLQNGASLAIGIALAIAAVQVLLGWWQWKKLTSWIPVIFLILAVYGFVSGLWALMGMRAAEIESVGDNPSWLIGLDLVVVGLCIVLHTAGLRGGLRLAKLRTADPAI